jgi:KUP system potassium uptake protein
MTAKPGPLPADPESTAAGDIVQAPAPAPGASGATAEYHVEADPHGKRLLVLTLTALGVVYGDIGTSPLYALRECFNPRYGLARSIENVYGVLSLIVWSLILVVAVKYIVFILRADNRGEGGILALLALVFQQSKKSSGFRTRRVLIALGLFGAALLYGDGVITPAITVLGAMEGLVVATPRFETFIIPVSSIILFLLFFAQRKGTANIGFVFGPVVMIWFGTIAVLGTAEVFREPRVLLALNPWEGVRFFMVHGHAAFLVLGAVVLAVTGAEALYADMGHFGKKPIRLAWFAVVLPALLLNYFGQGAILLRDPAAAENPFYMLAPRWFLYPLIAIATAAAIVASQALISGAFSLTQQAVQLGYSPRVSIIHTSKQEAGQIYIPEINKALMIGCIVLVVTFKTSSALGAAYGIAVTGTMVITSLLFAYIARVRWRWSLGAVVALTSGFLIIDLAFLAANAVKIRDGGWVPLAIAAGLFLLMTTWKRGREILRDILRRGSLPLDLFLDDVARRKPVRVSGTAVFMTSDPEGAPVVLLHHLKHNKVLHNQVLLLSVHTAAVPEVPPADRVKIEPLEHGFFRVLATYGFMQTPNAKEILARCNDAGIAAKPNETTYYLGRERLIPTGATRMARWRKQVFIFMSRNARSATEFFGIPPNRVVELGTQIEF